MCLVLVRVTSWIVCLSPRSGRLNQLRFFFRVNSAVRCADEAIELSLTVGLLTLLKKQLFQRLPHRLN